MVIDEEFENLKRRRLDVLNDGEPAPGDYRLEGESESPPSEPVDVNLLRDRIVSALRTVYDPEIPLNIYDLGLIYSFDVEDSGDTHLKMTLTAPGCPVAGSLVREVHDKLLGTPGIKRAVTELVWDPPWTRDRMSEAARLQLGLD